MFDLLYQMKIEYDRKEEIYGYVREGKTPAELAGILQTMELEPAVFETLCEVLFAQLS